MSSDDPGGDIVEDLRPLAEGAATLGLPLDGGQLMRFARYRELLLDWNARINLTAITDPAEVVTRHFLDSLTCVLVFPPEARAAARTLLDVGAGAGFPGLPLAIALPSWRVTLLEATAKKVRFLEAVIAELELPNATTLTGRAEELGRQPRFRGAFDIVAARAVAALPTLLEYCCPFAGVGGTTVMPKKGELATELAAGARAAPLLGAQLLTPIPIPLPTLSDDRVLVVARQERPCPPQYPRAAGAPARRPLGT
ncbi:MAG TPA: 16S rRNA (guanine(527)-N(7))-methyltransferase RsmG [Ktedonobacterales bacterium]|nr:16S rRNA (guanine(527)-N(7))-methyltransferase RsmG [Ktedonobacterales bacterium]